MLAIITPENMKEVLTPNKGEKRLSEQLNRRGRTSPAFGSRETDGFRYNQKHILQQLLSE